jgi:hypothetical protein
MTQPWNPNPYSDPRAYSGAGAAPSVTGGQTASNAQQGISAGTFATPAGEGANGGMYGGYVGGYADTRNDLLQRQQAASTQGAPSANLGQAHGYLGQVNGAERGIGGALGGLSQEQRSLENVIGGGQTAADTAFRQAQAQGAAAQQSAASAAAPGASFSAMARGAAGNQSYAAQQGVTAKAQLDFQQQQAALAQLQGVQAQRAQLLGTGRGLAQQAAGGAASLAEINPTLQQGQNALNAETAAGYNASLLGEQQSAQGIGSVADVNASNAYLGYQGIQTQQQQMAIGAATGAGGALAGGLSGAINSSGGASPAPAPAPSMAGYNPTYETGGAADSYAAGYGEWG